MLISITGAVEILRNLDSIDFKVLMSGKVCFDEIQRVKKLARMECIRMPAFMRNQEKYKKTIKQISQLNGLHLTHDTFKAPLAYLRRLKRGRRIGVPASNKKVRKKGTRGSRSGVNGDMGRGVDEGCTSDDEGSELCDDDRFFLERFELKSLQNYELKSFQAHELKGLQSYELKHLQNPKDPNIRGDYKNHLSLESICSDKSRSASTSFVNNPEKFRKAKDVPPASPVESESSQCPDSDSGKQFYRSISRASIQSRLSLRSYSLASRGNKNMNADTMSVASYSSDFVRPDSASSRISMAMNPAGSDIPSADLDDTSSAKVNLQPLSTNTSTNSTLAPLYTPALSSTNNLQNDDWCWDSTNLSAPATFYPKPAPLAPIRPLSRTVSTSSLADFGAKKFIYPKSDVSDIGEEVLDNMRGSTALLNQERSLGSWIQDMQSFYDNPEREGASRGAKLLKSRASSTLNLLAKI